MKEFKLMVPQQCFHWAMYLVDPSMLQQTELCGNHFTGDEVYMLDLYPWSD